MIDNSPQSIPATDKTLTNLYPEVYVVKGNFFTMMLSHNAENLNGKDVECMSVDFHGRPSSLSRFVQGRGRARDGYNDDVILFLV